MSAIVNTFVWIFFIVCIVLRDACGLQSAVLVDLKQMEHDSAASRMPNKVKRAQEVVMFGNQQNKFSERNYVRADKRDIPNVPVPDVQNNLDREEVEEPIAMESMENPTYQQLAPLHSRYYYDRPDIYEMEPYEDRQKRNIRKRSPLKRNNRIFRSYTEVGNRIKRESPLNKMNTEDLLALLEMLETENRRKHPSDSRVSLRYGHSEYEPYTNEASNEFENDGGSENEDWLDGPVLPTHRYGIKTRFYPPYTSNNMVPNRQVRRYKNNLDNDYSRARSELSENGQYDNAAPIQQRRFLV